METLTVYTGEDRNRTEEFQGYWVVPPSDDNRSGELGSDARTCYGIAHTEQGRLAVYHYHVNDRFPAALHVYNDVDDALNQDAIPKDIADEYYAEQGVPIVRDI